MGSARTHYEVLGIEREADDQAVRRAWKVLVQVWHPDRFKGEVRDEAEQMTSRINDAYHTLRDPAKRGAYNRKIQADSLGDSRPFAQSSSSHAPFRASPFAMRDNHSPRRSTAFNAYPPVPAPERTFSTVASELGRDVLIAAQRHPRVTIGAAALWLFVVGGSVLMNLVAGPSLPSASAGALSGEPRVAAAASIPSYADLAAADAAADAAAAAADAQDVAPTPTAPTGDAAASAQQLPTDEELGIDPAAADPQDPAYSDPRAYAPAPEAAAPRGRRIVRVLPNKQR